MPLPGTIYNSSRRFCKPNLSLQTTRHLSIRAVRGLFPARPRHPNLRRYVTHSATILKVNRPYRPRTAYQPKRAFQDLVPQSPPVVQRPRTPANVDLTYDKLRHASREGDYIQVNALVEYLVRLLGEKPSTRIYDALILANASPQYGSAAEVGKIFQEMEEKGITPDSATYHAILRVLAVHPDHLLRSHVLQALRHRWFSLTKDGYQDVIAGLVRERQLEVALKYLDRMRHDQFKVSSWVYDLLVYTLCNAEEFDEALRLMYERLDSGQTTSSSRFDAGEFRISGTLWYHLLDTASRNMHYPATLFAYNARVTSRYLNPPSGMCNNILACAARHGDPKLASSLINILSQRSGSPLQLQHYESLIEAYIHASDLPTALALLSSMSTSGHPPTFASTRPIFLYLKYTKDLTTKAHDILDQHRHNGHPVPLAALTVVLEAYIEHRNLPAALHIYNTLDLYTAPGATPPAIATADANNTPKAQRLKPDSTIFNLLLRGCTHARDKKRAMFFISEMVALKVSPDALTYDRLVLVCLSSDDDLEDAWRYVDEMVEAGFALRMGTLMALVKRGCQTRDERVWELEKGVGGRLERRVIENFWEKYGESRGVERREEG